MELPETLNFEVLLKVSPEEYGNANWYETKSHGVLSFGAPIYLNERIKLIENTARPILRRTLLSSTVQFGGF